MKAADADAPLVLIIPGSGPTDRDGNSPLGIGAGTYRLLAEGLAQKGISTVRIDKRGIAASAGAVRDANAVTIDDYVSDARAWVDDIRRRTGTSCVWILGHSEGGLVALATAQESPDICGLILVATAGRPLGDVAEEQLHAQPALEPILPRANAVTIDDYVSDARAWVDDIRRRTGTSCVWILGHSEGGLVALATAQESPDICGLILVATAGRPLGDVAEEQLRAQPALEPILPQADAAIDALASGKRIDAGDVPPALAPLFAPAIQGLLISVFALNPADLAGRVEKPVLILQGDRDIQVGVPDATALKAAAPTAELAVIPDVNHVLKLVSSDDAAANIATYADPALPLAPGIIETIADFLAPHTAADPF